MAQQIYRLAVAATDVPLHSSLAGRTVIVPNHDIPAGATASTAKLQGPKPKVIYAHNALPTNEGFTAVGYQPRVAAVPAATAFDECWTVNDAAGNFGLFSPAGGLNYFSAGAVGAWISNPVGLGRATKGIIGGQSYIAYPLNNIYTINCATGVLTAAGVVGINPLLDVIGITSANNYLIAYNATTLFWSSPTNPADFTPSLITGAGSGIPTELKGTIVACYPHLNGFYIHSTEGILLAQYSGNSQFPWVFKEIAGASALSDAENTTHSALDLYNVAYTASGFIRFSSQGSEPVFPEVSEFFVNGKIEDFVGGMLVDTAGTIASRITRVGLRYYIISYGIAAIAPAAQSFTHALVFDMALNRWGKLKIAHSYCFEFPSRAVGAESLSQLGFMASTGAVSTAGMAKAAAPVTDAVVIVGGIALTRGTFLTLQEVDVDAGTRVTTLSTMATMNGKTYTAAVPRMLTGDSYLMRVTALAHAICVLGDFTISSMQATTTQSGLR